MVTGRTFLLLAALASAWCFAGNNVVLASNLQPQTLTREAIAIQSMQVAQATQTSGRCYAAICRALKPLSINLSGASAYEAKDLLLNDNRFSVVQVYSPEQLMRGDIIVFDRSASHKDGHICVYQGNNTEASDHVAPVTNPQSYGGASVFRLNGIYIADGTNIPLAPDRSLGIQPGYETAQGTENSRQSEWNSHESYEPNSGRSTRNSSNSNASRQSTAEGDFEAALKASSRRYLRTAQTRLSNGLAQRLTRFLFDR
jgi:hypothetical protein